MRPRLTTIVRILSLHATLILACPAMRADDTTVAVAPHPLVIAHRGASGYLPEHTEGAKVLAFAQGADILEQDVVLSRDGIFVVSHDITMDHTTNVAEVFPDRQRADGRYYYADFDWSELRQIALHERSLEGKSGSRRFPFRTDCRLLKLEDEIKLVQGLNQTLGKNVGLHIELKAPSWHREHFGWSMGPRLIEVLQAAGIDPQSTPCFIQCFEAEELMLLSRSDNCPFPLVQLLGGRPLGLLEANPGTDRLQQIKLEIEEIAKYADGIGPSISLLVEPESDAVNAKMLKSTGLVELARRHGLLVHPYTVRADALPDWCSSLDELHSLLLDELKVDGFFSDFPDLGRRAVDSLSDRSIR